MDLLLRGRWLRAAKLYGLLLLVFVNVPILILAPISFGAGHAITFPPTALSFEWYEGLFGDPRWRRAAFLSIEVALLATLFAVVTGTLAAIGIHRAKGRVAKALKMLFIAPMIVPTMVLGVGFYITFARLDLLGQKLPLAVAHAIVVLPFVVMPILARLSSIDPALERASASLGGSPGVTLFHVTIPLLLPAIAAAAIFAFVFSFDEVVLAQLLAGPRFETLPRKVWEAITLDGADKTITAIATIQLVLVLAYAALSAVRRPHARPKT